MTRISHSILFASLVTAAAVPGVAAPNPPTLDLREPMRLAAHAIPPRLDPAQDYRPWFLLRGKGGVPVSAEHASWDLGDMTGRYLEGLLLARHMGISEPALSEAEGRLGRYLLKLLGPDGLVHDPASGAIDHPFSQGSALYGLVAWYEDSGDPVVRQAAERLITGLIQHSELRGDQLIEPAAKLAESSGSHLAGYQIYPAVRFYELTGYPDALKLAEGRTRWALADPVLNPNGEITKALSWEGHIHSWLDTLAGCVRTARASTNLNRGMVVARCRAVYEWVRRSNATSFGWIATYPTGGSSETCAISSAIRLALELAACGHPEYFYDVERFARNQIVEAQFRDLNAYRGGREPPTPLLLGCFDSQSMPNCHLGTRGGEDVGTVEGCCLNGGMRALALAWNAIETADENGLTVNIGLSRNGPAGEVIGFEPFAGGVDVVPAAPGDLRVRIPPWVNTSTLKVTVGRKPIAWRLDNRYVLVTNLAAKTRVSVRYPLRELKETVTAGGQKFTVRWKGNTVVDVGPKGGREPTYQDRLNSRREKAPVAHCPDTYELQDAARLAGLSMLARMDLQRQGQPFFRIYAFAEPPRAEHEKWDDGDMTGRYVEGLIPVRSITGLSITSRETLLRQYLARLFDPNDGLCYTRQTAWTPHTADIFSQSSAMLGLLAWYRSTGSVRARQLLDRQVDGLMRIAVDRGDYAYFPKYEFDEREFVDDPKGQDAPAWYGGRLILPLVDYWQITGREDVKLFIGKLVRFTTTVSGFAAPDGEVRGKGWWGHLHSTMDMAAGIAEFGRLADQPELIAWSRRVYHWVGRTHTTRYGWVADSVGSSTCESCAIGSRIRLGLALYRAGAADPFGEIDRCLRNQLLENQFVDLSFLPPLRPDRPRSDRTTYCGVDRMIRGTFQCWATANDLIGHDDIEGCGAGGGLQGIALAWDAQSEWRDSAAGPELRVHLLFNRRIRGRASAPLTTAAPVAAELWSFLPREGRVLVIAHQPIARLALRLPDGTDQGHLRLRRTAADSRKTGETIVACEGPYVLVPDMRRGEQIELLFPLKDYESTELVQGAKYRVRWKGSTVLSIDPKGTKVPLYSDRVALKQTRTPLVAPRYP